MEIEGPLHISVQDNNTSMKRELHLAFNPQFIQENLFERTEAFQRYLDHLKHDLQKLEKDNPDRLGIETILQICENLLENISNDELDLNEKIVIEISPTINIQSLMSSVTTIN